MSHIVLLVNAIIPEAHSNAIVKPPIALVSELVAILEPETDIKVKHGVIGLIKHLSQSPHNRAPLGEAGVITKLARSQIWGDKADMAELVQVSAIGIAKHLCGSNGAHVMQRQRPDVTASYLSAQLTTLRN